MRRWMRLLLAAALAVSCAILGVAFLYWLRWLPEAKLDRIDKISSGLGPPIAIASLIVAIGSGWAQRAIAPSWTVEEQERVVHDYLARRMSRSLTEEAARRELLPPYLQPIRWTGESASGTIHDLVGFFTGLPVRQLVILGEAGSGKSSMALRLAIDLAGDADLTPMIFPVSSWDRSQCLDSWLVGTLHRNYPELGSARRFGKGADACAVGLILPIFDAFDEISPAEQPSVLWHLRNELAAGRPLVLVSQERSFRTAVEQAGVILPRASEIEIQPLQVEEAAKYLIVGQHRGEARWQAVTRRIKERPRGGLAVLLSSPLMIYLARTAYEDPEKDPRELTVITVPHARAVLMSAFLPAAYGERAHRSDLSLRRYHAEDAERWLRFLARRMAARSVPALSWWRLPDLSPAAVRTLRAAVALVAVSSIGLRYGLLVGAVTAFAASGAIGSLTSGPQPVRIALRTIALVVGIIVGGTAGVMAAVFLLPEGSLVIAGLAGLVIGLMTALVVSIAIGGKSNENDFGLRESLRNDRNVLLAVLVISSLSGLRSGAQWNWWTGLEQFTRTTVLLLTILGLANVGVPWLRFAWTRLALMITRRTPARLVLFLEDAHRRGVLKRSGATYEFRHSTFLKYLSSQPPSPH